MNSIFNILSGGVKHGYRSDIDGLRAIACLAVVIFHAFPNHLKGGFVGVDIFFVISGFLISSILYRNLFNSDAPGRVNIVDFYIRRVRRIFPALLAVLITTLILGWFVLLPEEYKLLGKHTFGGATYINNFMLYKESGDYFNAASNAKPLLHLWSLGVEEQFYLIFPIILWLVYKTNLNFVLCLTVFTVVSFALNRNGVNHNQQTSAFYLPWCRFWELSIGAILAYIVNYHKDLVEKTKTLITDNVVADIISKFIFRNSNDDLRHNLVNNLISIVGLVTIIYGIATINNDITFPGTKALIPVFGALMIIGAGKTAVINKYILSNRVMVFLGLISYPLYLWHWPLLSLAYICEGQMPVAWIRGLAVVIAIVLATLTYFVIEPPLRYGSHSKTKAVGLFITLLVVGGLGLLINRNNGFPTRFNAFPYEFHTFRLWDKKAVLSAFSHYNDKIVNTTLNDLWIKVDNCLKDFPEWLTADHRCYMESDRNKVKFVLIGDSHAGNLVYGLQKLTQNTNVGFDSYQWSRAIPLYGFMSFTHHEHGQYNEKGSDLLFKAYNYEVNNQNIKLFVLAHQPIASYWDMTDKLDYSTNSKSPLDKYRIGMKRTVDFLTSHGKKVLFVLDNPLLPFEPNSCMKRPISLTNHNCSFNRDIYDKNEAYKAYNQAVKEIASTNSNVQYIDLSNLLCDDKNCHAIMNNDILYADSGHTNLRGSEVFGEYVYKKIKEMLDK